MEKIVLSNGLRVVTEKIPTGRSVSFGIWVRTGSRNENPLNNGISHFIEHMLFKGTGRFSAKDIAEQFDAIGGNVNAFTSKEYTCYYAKVLDEHLPIAVDVLSDMFFRSKMDAEELAKEKNVILEEIAMCEDTPDDLVHDLMSAAAYGEHPLAYSILGLKERLLEMTPDDLHAYMKEQYTIENTVISVAGNINDGLIELLERHFGAFDNHGQAPELTAPDYQGGLLFHRKNRAEPYLYIPAGRPERRSAAVSDGAAEQYGRRRNELTPVPGDPREARTCLFCLFVPQLPGGQRPVYRVCGNCAQTDEGSYRADQGNDAGAGCKGHQ